ncbi:MAG: hypothetical protein ABJA49_02525, partial [Betaproteobacteria bacterium]
QQGHRDGQSAQNWDQAEHEIRKAESQPANEAAPQPAAKDKSLTDTQAEPNPQAKAAPKAEPEAGPQSDLTPQLIERVHKLYEDLGRQDIQAVEELETAQRKGRHP